MEQKDLIGGWRIGSVFICVLCNCKVPSQHIASFGSCLLIYPSRCMPAHAPQHGAGRSDRILHTCTLLCSTYEGLTAHQRECLLDEASAATGKLTLLTARHLDK